MPFLDDQAGLTNSDLQRLVPVGAILPYTGASAPGGYLIPDGSLVLRNDFPNLRDLWSVQGYPFGAGDGSTTMQLPDARSRSLMMIGTGPGLSARAMGDSLGEEDHVLTVSELAEHTHVQDAHTHTTNAHNHGVSDPGHNHTQNAHTHVQDAHTHTQDAHTHIQDSHSHVIGCSGTFVSGTASISSNSSSPGVNLNLNSSVAATNQNATAVNQNTTATNQNATATNNSNTTGVSTDQNFVDVIAETATNNPEGDDVGHNTIHPVLCVNFILKY